MLIQVLSLILFTVPTSTASDIQSLPVHRGPRLIQGDPLPDERGAAFDIELKLCPGKEYEESYDFKWGIAELSIKNGSKVVYREKHPSFEMHSQTVYRLPTIIESVTRLEIADYVIDLDGDTLTVSTDKDDKFNAISIGYSRGKAVKQATLTATNLIVAVWFKTAEGNGFYILDPTCKI